MAGLHRARRDGVGCDADISLFETALHQLVYVGTWTATEQWAPRRMASSAHPSIVPFQAFETADGWITVACAKPKFWERLCDVLERPDLIADERFADFAARDRNRDVLLPIIADLLRQRTTDDWVRTFTAAGVPNGPVNEVAAALEDPQTDARGDMVEIEHPRFGPVRQVASPLRLSGSEHPRHRAPFRGEHTYELLRDVCGYGDEQLDALRAAGAFGDLAPAAVGGRD
jgi:crotonobetainyl-CoA:carnitine CoA-transferase CaiB-like acyl-CoA transferase